MGSKFTPYVIENLEIIDATNEGISLGKHNNAVVFVPHLIPGDVADVKVIKKKRNYFTAQCIEIKQKSEHRVSPECSHFGVCGGCKWQHMDYSTQLQYKQKQVLDAFTRIGKLEFEKINDIIGSQNIYHYRNKLDFAFAEKRWLLPEEIDNNEIIAKPGLGFHLPRFFDKVVEIEECLLMDDYVNQIRNGIREYAVKNQVSFYNARTWSGLMRNLVVRRTSKGEWMLIVVFGYEDPFVMDLMRFIDEKFSKITSLNYIINTKKNDSISDLDVILFKGKEFIEEEMEGLTFRVSPLSFYQTNSDQAYVLYKITREFAKINSDDVVYDLYTGAGTIANFVAKSAKKVVGIEYVDMAIEDAQINSKINNVSNTSFFAGDMAKVLNDDFVSKNGKPDIIITDPPRAGMHPDVVEQILKMLPKRIVYVSCNPATQARDIASLISHYKISAIQPVDMFPHTQHVENVCCLERID